MNTIPFNKENMKKEMPVIIYGASTYGEIAYAALKKIGINVCYYCDRFVKGEYLGVKVIEPKDLEGFINANIIIASRDYFYDIKNILVKIGCKNIYDMRDLLAIDLSDSRLSVRAMDMYVGRDSYIDVANNQSSEMINFPRIQFVITERCSLRCRDCISLMQYYEKPENVEIEDYIGSFDRLIRVVDNVSELRILGGEPYMNPDVYKVIERYVGLKKIATISVYTNGTIVPNEQNLRALENDKVILHISNYNHNEERVNKLIKEIKKYSIKYFVRNYDAWNDCGKLECKGYSVEEMKKVFSKCFERGCYSFFRGKLHVCPRSAHAMYLKAMPDIKDDYVDLMENDISDIEIKKQLMNLTKKTYIEACNYCQGPDYSTPNIPAAIQINKPLSYVRRE